MTYSEWSQENQGTFASALSVFSSNTLKLTFNSDDTRLNPNSPLKQGKQGNKGKQGAQGNKGNAGNQGNQGVETGKGRGDAYVGVGVGVGTVTELLISPVLVDCSKLKHMLLEVRNTFIQ
jgi:hypothetical protein